MSHRMAAGLALVLLLAVPAAGQSTLCWKLALPPRAPAWRHTPRAVRDTAYPISAVGDIVLVACEHNNALLAVDLTTGGERWRFYADGPLRRAAATDGKQIYVGSDDGHLYALDLEGRLLWRHRGGPGGRKVLGHQRLISVWPAGAGPLVVGDHVYWVAGHWPIDDVYVHALSAADGEVVWTRTADYRPQGWMLTDGETLFVYGYGGRGSYDLATGRDSQSEAPRPEPPRELAVPGNVEGDVLGHLTHEGYVLFTTAQGGVYCFADRPRAASAAPPATGPDAAPGASSVSSASDVAERLVRETGVSEGYALVLGLEDGGLVEGLLRASRLHVIAVDDVAATVDRVRRRLDAQGLFDDHRLEVWLSDLSDLELPPCLASLITSESDLKPTEELMEILHPYGGTFAVPTGSGLLMRRRAGPPEGSGQWTHEFANAANSLSSDERLVRAPLGILWYEGPAGDARFYFDGEVDHQSGHSVSPLPPGPEIVDGRMILEGPGRLAAFDIYTGRLLWETELPEVYGFGGPGGGVGVHSEKHREPWLYPPAMEAAIPATHHSRTTGLNFTSASDRIYVAAGQSLLAFDPADGSRKSDWPVPLPEADEQTLCWGSIRVDGNQLVATAFRSQDLVDAQCGHDGNGGDWAKDRMPMAWLMVLDRRTGRLLWSRQANLGWLNRGIAVGRGEIFCLDTITAGVLEKFEQAGRHLPERRPTLYALDAADGRVLWKFEPGVLATNLTYAASRELLIVPCRNLSTWEDGRWVRAGDSRTRNAPGRMFALHAGDGRIAWQVDNAPYFEPHIALGDMLIDRDGFAYDLQTGERHRRQSPLTGESETWHFRKGGCNHLVACPGVITWRTAFYDLAGHSGVTQLRGMNAGCSPTLIPAGGVLSVPNFGTHHKRSRMAALALVHRPNNAAWTQYGDPQAEEVTPIRRVGYNFGAPGDRVADDGTLWLHAPRRNVTVEPKDAGTFRLATKPGASWITSSGLVGATKVSLPVVLHGGKRLPEEAKTPRRYDVRLYFPSPQHDAGAAPTGQLLTVTLEGRPVLQRFDHSATATGGEPVVRKIQGVEIDGVLDIELSAEPGPSVLCGVELIAHER